MGKYRGGSGNKTVTEWMEDHENLGTWGDWGRKQRSVDRCRSITTEHSSETYVMSQGKEKKGGDGL